MKMGHLPKCSQISFLIHASGEAADDILADLDGADPCAAGLRQAAHYVVHLNVKISNVEIQCRIYC